MRTSTAPWPLGMEPILPVYAAPWANSLPVTTVILPKDSALQALKTAMADKRRKHATWFTDGSLLEGRAGGAAVRVEDGKECERLMEPLGNGQVCDGEMVGLVCSTTKELRDECTCILCVADSQAVLQGILSTKPRSGQFRAILYDQLVRDAMLWHPHLTIVNMRTPAYIGTVGNELADDAAKEATAREPDPSLFVSLTSVRRHIHLLMLNSWDARWKITKAGVGLRAVDKSPPSLIPAPLYSSSSLSSKTSSNISQLCTGFVFLDADRAKSGFVDSAPCDACGNPFETRAHFLLECQSWEPACQLLYTTSRSAGLFGPLHVAPLPLPPKASKGAWESCRNHSPLLSNNVSVPFSLSHALYSHNLNRQKPLRFTSNTHTTITSHTRIATPNLLPFTVIPHFHFTYHSLPTIHLHR
ncbi:hypothetical protein DFH07DRAFT_831203 [Mycena maculata]|uniref:RNase H type-1 domain-containing protein n=1 Tax=Mycena maculata TaxID=230809 RepID=A0AAD7N591_9AGAR|nr:hypothetical protein DFH07DRAFT_831203 [Mycena maculata]